MSEDILDLFIFSLLIMLSHESFCKAQALTPSTCSRNPAMVWYTHQLHTISVINEETLTCYKGSEIFKCNVYPREAAPENPEAYLFYGFDIDRFPLPRDPKTIWALYQDETPKSKPMLMHEKALNLFNFSSTFSRHSDVPNLLINTKILADITSTESFINTSTKNSFLCEIAPVVFFQRDCFTFTEREEYVLELYKYIKVDTYGGCYANNLSISDLLKQNEWLNEEAFTKLLARYKFQISIENAVCNDYMTEKLWRAIELGVVPIYYGSPLIRDWLPNNKSAILLEDFPTPKLLSEHLHYLLQNDTAYEEYLEHKTLGLISNLELINYVKAPYDAHSKFHCLICERIHNRNSTRVNIVTKKHYDCQTPKSALTLSVNLNNTWLKLIEKAESTVDKLVKEIEDSNKTRRSSNTSWDWICLSSVNLKEDVIKFCTDL